jgi:hypothetical protein
MNFGETIRKQRDGKKLLLRLKQQTAEKDLFTIRWKVI